MSTKDEQSELNYAIRLIQRALRNRYRHAHRDYYPAVNIMREKVELLDDQGTVAAEGEGDIITELL